GVEARTPLRAVGPDPVRHPHGMGLLPHAAEQPAPCEGPELQAQGRADQEQDEESPDEPPGPCGHGLHLATDRSGHQGILSRRGWVSNPPAPLQECPVLRTGTRAAPRSRAGVVLMRRWMGPSVAAVGRINRTALTCSRWSQSETTASLRGAGGWPNTSRRTGAGSDGGKLPT